MASRSDQLHSHQFTLQRVVGALAMRDPDPASSPLRRIGGALFAGVMVAALALAAVGVYGVLRPSGGSGWRDGNAVIIEEETGARFVYRDGVLYPVLNYSSALLILGSAQPARASVPRAALVGVPRGTPLGIPGAPDLLPAPADLVTTAWTLCSRRSVSGAESVLAIGSGAGPAEPLGDRAILASDSSGGLHLVWHERRYPISSPELVLAAFAWSRQLAVPVAAAFLNAMPAAAELGRLRIERSSQPSVVAGFAIGQVFVVENAGGGRQFGVTRPGGLADITQVQADLLIADGANGAGGKAKPMGQAEYAAAPRAASGLPTGDGAPPAVTPILAPVGPDGEVCAAFADGAAAPETGVRATAVRSRGELRAGGTAVAAPLDWVAVAAGRGAVVEALSGPGAPSGALAMVSDLGLRFPVPSPQVLGFLGYDSVRPVRLPAPLVALLPTGRALDPAAAVLPVANGA